MTPERWQKVKDVFDEAVQRGPASRLQYIRERCGDDDELRREVESLLASDLPTGSLLDNALTETGSGLPASYDPSVVLPPQYDSFGPYVPVRVLGEGGMGTVYFAQQQRPIRREVALKVVKLGMDSRQVLERFEIERQALALMDHPNVARVLDAGTSDRGRPYFVMEFVEGVPITQYCDSKALSTRERLQLFVPVCNALQHAHQKGIIHRDVKPSNVLVTEVDGKPVPKVIDFGVARATDQRSLEWESFTLSGQLIGTPEYMSPEQASLENRDIDTSTDVYSLGVVLYELLVGVLPLDIKSMRKIALSEVLRAIREMPASKPTARITELGAAAEGLALNRKTSPGQLKRDLAGDLDAIVMKAIDKERCLRYASASEFAADIERYLRQEPVAAGPPSLRYRAGKFVRRHRGAVLVSVGIFLALVCGIFVATWQAEVARQERQRAERRTQQVRSLALSMLDHIDEQVKKLPESRSGAELQKAVNRVRGSLIQQATKALNVLADPSEQPYGLSRYLTKVRTRSHQTTLMKLPNAWFPAGYSPELYEMGIDRRVFHSGTASGYIGSKTAAEGGDWATLMQRIRADEYRGRRVRLSAFIKSESVREGAHLWLRVDALGGIRAFDAMQRRPIRGTTDWRKYELVLDVPGDSIGISFGLLLIGQRAKAWIDDLDFEVVTAKVPITGLSQTALRESGWAGAAMTIPDRPANLGFENGDQAGSIPPGVVDSAIESTTWEAPREESANRK